MDPCRGRFCSNGTSQTVRSAGATQEPSRSQGLRRCLPNMLMGVRAPHSAPLPRPQMPHGFRGSASPGWFRYPSPASEASSLEPPTPQGLTPPLESKMLTEASDRER